MSAGWDDRGGAWQPDAETRRNKLMIDIKLFIPSIARWAGIWEQRWQVMVMKV